jgi:hypothetical protein
MRSNERISGISVPKSVGLKIYDVTGSVVKFFSLVTDNCELGVIS